MILGVIRRKITPSLIDWVVITLAGIALFQLLWGLDLTWPGNTTWLTDVNGSDRSQHFFGWAFFADDSWHFPLGKTDDYGYPNGVSISYTDSIPLLAIPLKLVGFSADWQYFGVWNLLSYISMGGVSYALLHRLGQRRLLAILGGVLLMAAPVLSQRSFGHVALTAQWLIPAALLIVLSNLHGRTAELSRAGLLTAALLIHPYMAVQVGVVFFAGYAADFLFDKGNWWQRLKTHILKRIVNAHYMLLPLIIGFVSGVFYNSAPWSGGVQRFSSNLNTLINPLDEQAILPVLPLAQNEQSEGFGYLGAGVIGLVILAVITMVWRAWTRRPSLEQFANHQATTLIIVAVIGAGLASAGSLTLNEHDIFTVPLGYPLEPILSTMRASGRFIWLTVYPLTVVAIISLGSLRIRHSLTVGLIALLTLVQIIELGAMTQPEQTNLQVAQTPANQLVIQQSRFFDADRHQHVLIIPTEIGGGSVSNTIQQFAHENDLTLNYAYYAREYPDLRDNGQSLGRQVLDQGRPPTGYLVIISSESDAAGFMMTHGSQSLLRIGDYYVLP